MGLSRYQAMVRFGAISSIELAALAICLLPLLSRQKPWQADCLGVGIATTIVALVIITVACIVAFALPKNRAAEQLDASLDRVFESAIVTLYVLNLVSLCLVIARTGGPGQSLFGPLIPILLSVILLLQVQRDRWCGAVSLMALLYTAVAAGGVFVSYRFQAPLAGLVTSATESASDLLVGTRGWHAFLTISGMILAYLSYLVPEHQGVQAKLKEWYP